MSTTAHHRNLAREHADALQWHIAAHHMRQAIALYPLPLRAQAATPGTLAALDLERMNRQASAWERQAEIEEWESEPTLVDLEF